MSRIKGLQAIEYSVDILKVYAEDRIALYNEERISEAEVREYIETGMIDCEYHPLIVTMRKEQYENLMDKHLIDIE